MKRLAVPLLLLVSCTPPAAPPAPAKSGPDVVMDGVRVRQVRGVETVVEATSPHVELDRATGDFRGDDAGAWLPASGLTVQAHQARGNVGARVIEGSDGVELRGRDGLVGRAPTARFEKGAGEQGQASSDAGVRVTKPGVTLDARGFTYDVATESAVFDQPVTRVEKAP